MWRIERQKRLWKPYYWVCAFSSYGAAVGYAWTRRRAERDLSRAQADLLSDL